MYDMYEFYYDYSNVDFINARSSVEKFLKLFQTTSRHVSLTHRLAQSHICQGSLLFLYSQKTIFNGIFDNEFDRDNGSGLAKTMLKDGEQSVARTIETPTIRSTAWFSTAGFLIIMSTQARVVDH